MSEFQLGEIIVEREFESLDFLGNLSRVIFQVSKPQLKDTGRWYCTFQIIGIGNQEVEIGYGVDPLQALLMVLQKAPIIMKYLAKHEQKKITWLGRDDLGFTINLNSK